MTAPAGTTGTPTRDQRPGVVVLLARPARRREPAATVWRLLSYDPATRTPEADIAQRWQPAGSPPTRTGPVPDQVTGWVATVLGPHAIGPAADAYAGSDSWQITTTGTGPVSGPAGERAPMTG